MFVLLVRTWPVKPLTNSGQVKRTQTLCPFQVGAHWWKRCKWAYQSPYWNGLAYPSPRQWFCIWPWYIDDLKHQVKHHLKAPSHILRLLNISPDSLIGKKTLQQFHCLKTLKPDYHTRIEQRLCPQTNSQWTVTEDKFQCAPSLLWCFLVLDMYMNWVYEVSDACSCGFYIRALWTWLSSTCECPVALGDGHKLISFHDIQIGGIQCPNKGLCISTLQKVQQSSRRTGPTQAEKGTFVSGGQLAHSPSLIFRSLFGPLLPRYSAHCHAIGP